MRYVLYEVTPPVCWKAGASVSTDGTETPFYFDCGDCAARDVEVAGLVARPGLGGRVRWTDVAILTKQLDGREVHAPALFCPACTDRRKSGEPRET